MFNSRKMNLRADLITEFLESFGIKLCSVVHSYSLRYAEATNNVLPEEFLGSLRCYCRNSPCLDPFGEVFDSDEGELKVSLSGGQGPDNVQAPALERPCMGNQLCILRGVA